MRSRRLLRAEKEQGGGKKRKKKDTQKGRKVRRAHAGVWAACTNSCGATLDANAGENSAVPSNIAARFVRDVASPVWCNQHTH